MELLGVVGQEPPHCGELKSRSWKKPLASAISCACVRASLRRRLGRGPPSSAAVWKDRAGTGPYAAGFSSAEAGERTAAARPVPPSVELTEGPHQKTPARGTVRKHSYLCWKRHRVGRACEGEKVPTGGPNTKQKKQQKKRDRLLGRTPRNATHRALRRVELSPQGEGISGVGGDGGESLHTPARTLC